MGAVIGGSGTGLGAFGEDNHGPGRRPASGLEAPPAAIKRDTRAIDMQRKLQELRQRRGVTQGELLGTLDMTEANVSRIEHEDDLHIATLDRFVAGLGGRLEIRAVFDDEEVSLTWIQNDESPAGARLSKVPPRGFEDGPHACVRARFGLVEPFLRR